MDFYRELFAKISPRKLRAKAMFTLLIECRAISIRESETRETTRSTFRSATLRLVFFFFFCFRHVYILLVCVARHVLLSDEGLY